MVKLGIINDEVSERLSQGAANASPHGGSRTSSCAFCGTKTSLQLSYEELNRAKAILDEHGLKVTAIASPIFKSPLDGQAREVAADFALPGVESFEAQLELLERACNLCDFFGTRLVRVFTFWKEPWSETLLETVASKLLKAAALAQARDKVLAVENEPVCSVGTGRELAALCRVLQGASGVHAHVGALWDPGNALAAGETSPYPDGYEALGACNLVHVHLKDLTFTEEGQPQFVPLGQGRLDYEGQLRRLKEDGYEGAFVLEPHYRPARPVSGGGGFGLCGGGAGAVGEGLRPRVSHPASIGSVVELERILATPSPALVEDMARLEGDIMVLGAGGKMGPSLARLARRRRRRRPELKGRLSRSRAFRNGGSRPTYKPKASGLLGADLMDDEQLGTLPDVPNILYLVARKFGTTGDEPLSWALNTYLPGRVAERFRKARIVAFSSGNIYPLVPVSSGGASEEHAPEPVGEYAQSVLGRERLFGYGSVRYGTPLLLLRLNYAIDLRYGVLLEVAKAVFERTPIDLSMGHVNVIWQGDANEVALRALHHCASPPKVLNVTGPETVSVRWLAERFGESFGQPPVFENEERPNALLSNASRAHELFEYPKVTLRQMMAWVAHWVTIGGETLNKPSHFGEREGRF